MQGPLLRQRLRSAGTLTLVTKCRALRSKKPLSKAVFYGAVDMVGKTSNRLKHYLSGFWDYYQSSINLQIYLEKV